MRKRHTIESVKEYFKKHGCELLEEEYKNYHYIMKYKCNCGNISKISFANFKAGKRCMECKGNKKYKIKYIKQYFKDNNCELLEEEYKNNSTPMKYKCSCGNMSKISFQSLKRGTRCNKCKGFRLAKYFKFNFQDVKQYFKEHGCELLEEEYKNNSTPMKYKCNCGNISKIKFLNFKNRRRCKKCGYKKTGDKQKFSFKFIYNYFKKQNCELLEEKYKNVHTLMKYKCNCGNVSKISFANFKKGHRCNKCGKERQKRFGKDNHCYNPNLTDEERNAQKSRLSNSIYKEWRNSVFKRDKYICQNKNCKYCKNKYGGLILHAHHIKSFSKHENCRFDINNGITYCSDYHRKLHSEIGYKGDKNE